MALCMGLSQGELINSGEEAAVEEEIKFLVAEVSGYGEESGEGTSAENMKSSLYADADDSTETTEVTKYVYLSGGWLFLGRLGISVRGGHVDLRMDCDGLF